MKKTTRLKTFSDLITLSDNFSNEEICRKYMEKTLWGDTPVCPHCESVRVYKFKDGKRYKCANNRCYSIFNVTVGTYLENTKIPLRKWLHALYIFSSHKKGISSHQLAKDIGITQKSAWFMLSRLREVLKEKAPVLLEGVCEADESHFGGKVSNMHVKKRKAIINSTSPAIKTAVFGMVERNGRVFNKVVPDVYKATLIPLVNKIAKKGTIINTDSSRSYKDLKLGYTHHTINHEKNEFVRNDIHTQTIEGYWSQMKRGIYGVYHHASARHLHRYCNEFSFRWNTRKCREVERFDIALSQMTGRLKYKELIKK